MSMFKKLVLLCSALLFCGVMTLAVGCDEEPTDELPDSSTQTSTPDGGSSVEEFYTVTFKNYDGTVLKTVRIEAGAVPSYTGETPQKAGDVQYHYVFSGWDKPLSATTADVVYTAQFTQQTNAYVVTFLGEDDTELQSSSVNYGEKVVFSGEIPDKEGYTFSYWYVENGNEQTPWDIENDTVTGELTLKIAYALNTYKVSFTPISGGDAIPEQTVNHGEKATEPALATKDGWTWAWYNGNEEWDFDNVITEEITLKAKYTQMVTATETFEVYASVTTTKDADTKKVTGYSLEYNTFEIVIPNMDEVTVWSVAVNGTETQEYTFNTNRLVVNGNVFGSKNYGDVEILLKDENGDFAIVVNVPVVTKYMESFDDLNNMIFYGGIDLSAETKPYDGYFVMTQSIDCANNYINRPSDYVYTQDIGNSGNTAYANVGKCGFAGVFDGQGFAIENIQAIQYHYGLFGNTQTGSVIKNLAITATLSASTDYGRVLLGNNLAGEIQNCYFDVTVGNVTLASGKHLGGALGLFISGKLTDVVLKFDTTNVPAGVQVGLLALQLHPHPTYWENRAVFENVHVFSQIVKLYSYVGDHALGIVNRYGYNESATVTMADNTYWNMAGDQPVFKSVTSQAIKTISYEQDFEVYSSINGTTPVANAFTLDLTAYNIPANPNSITIRGDRASMTVDNSCWANGVLTIADLGTKVYGDVTVEFETDEVLYKVTSIKVVTKYLANYTDLKNIFYYGGVDMESATKTYDGYFVMTANIDGTGTYFNHANAFKDVLDANCYDGTGGFAGVFDGNGYKIYNTLALTNAHGGIFGCVGKTAVIKNVKIESNVKITNDAWAGGYILGKGVAGTIENVYFDVTLMSDTTSENVCYLARFMANARMKDVVVKVNSLTSTVKKVALAEYGAQWTGSVHANLMYLENVHIFTNVETAQPYAGYYPISGGTTPNVYALDEVPATAITMTDSTCWDLSGQPVWKERTQA